MNAHEKGIEAATCAIKDAAEDLGIEIGGRACRNYATAAIRDYLEASGQVLAPLEPTEVMVMTQGRSNPTAAASEAARKGAEKLNTAVRRAAILTYREMLAAYPQPLQPAEEPTP